MLLVRMSSCKVAYAKLPESGLHTSDIKAAKFSHVYLAG